MGTLIQKNEIITDFKANFHIIIIGAGLVGLATSILLKKAGYKVTVLERDSELREIGAGIQLPVNSSKVLIECGVFDRVIAKSLQPPSIILYSYKDGKVLSDMKLIPDMQDKYGAPHLVIHRVDLRRILYEEAKAQGVHIRLGVTIAMAKTDLGNNILYLAADETVQGDLIIGTDGAQSACKELLTQRPNRTWSTGKMVNRIVIDANLLQNSQLNDLISPPNIHTWLGPGSMAVCYLLKGAFNIVLSRPAGDEPVFFGPRPVPIEEVRSFFSNWDPRLRKLLELGQDFQKWVLWECDDEPLPSWTHANGRFTLIGDAVHASLPYLAQGAAIGLESASVLSYLLSSATHPSQIPELLYLNNSLRQPRVRRIIEASKRAGEMWMLPDGPLQVERDRVFLEKKGEGYPNMLEDPEFQEWLWGVDARGGSG